MDPKNANSIEHQNVPEAHQGLHDFLYDAADAHAADPVLVSEVEQVVDTPVAVQAWCNAVQNSKVAGVYAVLDRDGQTQFIGYSRNVALSLRSHLMQKGDIVCALVRVQPFKFPKRAAMEQTRNEWIAALLSPPPGNLDGTWAATIKDAATQAMSTAERADYEEKKLKLRRAMADGTLHQETAAAPTAAAQRQALAAAMNDDNWSAVIQAQTQETQPE